MPAVRVERSQLHLFSHENQSYPPSLSNYGALRSGTKADLLVCVSELVLHHDTVKPHEGHMVILDGAAIFNMIKPRTPVSFAGYITQVMEYVRKQFHDDVQWVDMGNSSVTHVTFVQFFYFHWATIKHLDGQSNKFKAYDDVGVQLYITT